MLASCGQSSKKSNTKTIIQFNTSLITSKLHWFLPLEKNQIHMLVTVFFCLLPLCWGLSGDELVKELHDIQISIDRDKHLKRPHGDQMEPASSIYLTRHWENFTGDKPIMIAMMNYHFQRYGNFIGNYFDDISCAKVAGLHFIGVQRIFDNDKEKKGFWEALPTILPHPNPAASFQDAAIVVRDKCKCNRYCWSYDDPVMSNMPFLSKLVRQSVYAHLRQEDEFGVSLLVRSFTNSLVEGVDIFPRHLLAQPPPLLPLIPDVAIHYRCSDNLFGGMGLLSFGTLLKLIPSSSKTIYILTEYGNRLNGTPLAKASSHILHRLYSILITAFPKAVVVIKRGGNEATAVAQMTLANKVTICSASTFCFWSAIGQTNTVYMPPTSYIAYSTRHKSYRQFPELPHFHWLKDASIFNNFTKDTEARDIIRTLSRDVNKTVMQAFHYTKHVTL